MNQRIRALDARFVVTDTTCLLLCECELAGCTGNVEVPVEVHAEACATPGRFVVIPGHETDRSTVIARTPTYVVAYERDVGGARSDVVADPAAWDPAAASSSA